MSLQRAPADSRLVGESVPLDPGALAKRPEEHGPVQQCLGAAREGDSLPPVAAERVGRDSQAGRQLGDRCLGPGGRAMAREVADALDGLDHRPVRRTRGEQTSTQQPERIVMPGCDPRDYVGQAIDHFLGPDHVNPLGLDPAEPLKTADRQRGDHDARGGEESPARHPSEPLHICCGASAQTDDPDVRVGEERAELTTGRRGLQRHIREQPLDRLPKGARLVIHRDHGAPSRIGEPQGYIRLIMQRACSQYNDLICEFVVAKPLAIVAISCMSPGKAA